MTIDGRFKTLIAAVAFLVLARPAFADAIDGNWCHDDGRHFSIRGVDIVTPGGAHIQGDYRRHEFSYRVPAAEPGAGQTVDLMLVDEDTVYLRRSDVPADKPPEKWVRCTPSISWLMPRRQAVKSGRL